MKKCESWDMNPKTGDYLMENGAPIPTLSLRIPAYIRLKAHRGAWMYAPNDRWGSDFFSLRVRSTEMERGNVETVAYRAMEPIIEDGRAQQIVVTTSESGARFTQLEADITDAVGDVERLSLNPVGVS